MSNSSALRSKIKALVDRAENSASSDAEVEAAMSRAQDLMIKHGLSFDDITGADAAQVLVAEGEIVTGRTAKALNFFIPALAKFCGVRVFKSYEAYTPQRKLNWVGYEPDIDLAQYLFGVITRAIMAESRKHHPARTRDDFARAMAARIGKRLLSLTEEVAVPTSKGNELVAIKDAAIRDAMDQLGLKTARRQRAVQVNEDAFYAGRKAGDQVGLHRPVGAAAGRLALPAS